jgi:hypothetical protein
MDDGAGGHENEQRQTMFGELKSAVEDGGIDFSLERLEIEEFVDIVDIIEYMDIKRRSQEDPVMEQRWLDSLESFLNSRFGREVSRQDFERIGRVLNSIQVDKITQRDIIEDNGEISTGKEKRTDSFDVKDWDNDNFSIELPEDEIKRLLKTPIVRHAVLLATGLADYFKGVQIEEAVKLFREGQDGSISQPHKGQLIIDYYVMGHAVNLANGKADYLKGVQIEEAVNCIEKNASDSQGDRNESSVVFRMRRALDKEIFKYAVKLATGKADRFSGIPLAGEAVNCIEKNASCRERSDAMIRQISFEQ